MPWEVARRGDTLLSMDDVEPCHRCGAPLGDDPEDDPAGGQPLCGECVRSHDEAADLGALDAIDGELDGMIDL